jgi:hypothetical protein
MSQARKPKQKQASSETPAKMPATRGFKQPGKKLADIIKRVNLVSKDDKLPETIAPSLAEILPTIPKIEELEAAIATLPQKLAAYLRSMLHEEPWEGFSPTGRILRVISVYNRIYSDREALYRVISLIEDKEIGYLRECRNCGRIFFAGRDNQWYCPNTCSKKKRQKEWLRNYEEKHGHSYRPKTREPRHVAKVRQALERWEKPLDKPTYEDMKELAALADVTVKQCQAAYDYLKHEKELAPKKGRKKQ